MTAEEAETNSDETETTNKEQMTLTPPGSPVGRIINVSKMNIGNATTLAILYLLLSSPSWCPASQVTPAGSRT